MSVPHPARFPWWIPVGGVLLALVYLPTLAAPFDFIDDGDLVYPVSTPTLGGQVQVWWDRVTDNVAHLGPFRPVLHAHWQLQANVLNADPLAWRAVRLAWCALAAIMLLWLMRELRAHPVAALVAVAAAMWNPYRGEVWRSLTLAEGVAMPYALLALVAARKAAFSNRSWRWDAAAVFGLLLALGCKNVFVALVPAMLVLRLSNGFRWRAAVYLLPVAMPAAHFIYFKLNWKPGNYAMGGPSWEQALGFVQGLKGALSADYLAAGVLLVLGCVCLCGSGVREPESPSPLTPLPPGEGGTSKVTIPFPPGEGRTNILAALALLAAGFAVYLPVNVGMSGRYTMPAAWGGDILLALLLTRFLAIPDGRATRVAWAGVAVGLLAVTVASVGRQEKDAARSRLLWEVVEHVEKTAALGEPLAWIGGDSAVGELNVEEGIHFRWHLLHRGRGDIRVGLFDAAGAAVSRAELPPLEEPPRLRLSSGGPGDRAQWEPGRTFTQTYRLGRKRFESRLETTIPLPAVVSGLPKMPTILPATGQGFMLDARTAKFMHAAFGDPGREFDTHLKQLPPVPGIDGPADLLIGPAGR